MYRDLSIAGFDLVRRYECVTSTMDVARQILEELPAPSPDLRAVITANEQSAGRGRQGRSWQSGAGSFMATFIFGLRLPIAALSGYSLGVGVGVAWAIESLGGRIQLKWPNDLVYVSEDQSLKKLGGVLIEVQELNGQHYLLIGLGLNVDRVPDGVKDIATSLHELKIKGVNVDELLEPLCRSLVRSHEAFVVAGGFSALCDEWLQRSCFTKDKTQLGIDLGDSGTINGIYCGVSSNGALLINSGNEQRAIISGHIVSISHTSVI